MALSFYKDEDTMSNDTDTVEYIDSMDEEDPDSGECRPIMLLLRRLIRDKQNTVMTNAQIIDILRKEFDININLVHELEVDIYIKIIKKYLKDWPQWEELERISTKLSNIKDFDAVTKVLDHKYKNLKEYLGVMLEAAKPLARDAVKNIVPENTKPNEMLDSSDVIMEIQCTREQLNNLFFRKPRLDLNNTVFNMSQPELSRISVKTLPILSILNWCAKISINLPLLTFKWEVGYKLKHVLVNKAHYDNTPQDISLDTNLKVRTNKKSKDFNNKIIIKVISNLLQNTNGSVAYDIVNAIFNTIKPDLESSQMSFKIPGSYRKYANKYKYVRYLYVDNEQSEDQRYDLQLEETISPMYLHYFGKVYHGKHSLSTLPIYDEWLQIECVLCKVKFSGLSRIVESVQAHFSEYHQNEPDWQCSHCKRLFSMEYLSANMWRHEC